MMEKEELLTPEEIKENVYKWFEGLFEKWQKGEKEVVRQCLEAFIEEQ